jgi:hypothetical protein
MRQVDTVSRNLPAPLNAGMRRPFFSRDDRGTPRTEFLSQLIADHQLAPGSANRRSSPREVLRIYDAGGKLRVLRLPPGYRLSLEA